MNNPKKPVAMPAVVHPGDAAYTHDQYDASQAAVYLKVSRNVLYQLARDAKIGHVKVSPFRIAFSQRDLDAYHATRPRVAATMPAGLRLAASEHDQQRKKSRYA
jgi:hypothetical protein